MKQKYTKKQMLLLYFLHPGPVGLGMKIWEAAQALGISVGTAMGRLQRFKKNNPEGWTQFCKNREVSRRERGGLRGGLHGDLHSPTRFIDLEDFDEDHIYSNIKEIF